MEMDFGFLAAYLTVVISISAVIGLLELVSMCFLFNKAGEPWWAAIIPIYSTIVFLKISDKPWWWLLLFFIPIVDIVLAIVVCVHFVKNFGRAGAEVLLMLFFSFVYLPCLAFSKNVKYKTEEVEEAA